MKSITKFFALLCIFASTCLLAEHLPFTPETLLSNVNPTTNKSILPSIAMNNSGQAVIAWHVNLQNNSINGNIFVSTRDSFGIWSKPFQINSKFGGSANIAVDSPSVAMNDKGEILVAWETNEPNLGIGNIYIATRNSNGIWSDEQQINSTTGGSYNLSENPKAALNDKGEAVVCWCTSASSNRNIYAASRCSQGVWSDEQQINSTIGGSANVSFDPQVAMNNSGEAIVCWETVGNSRDIYAASRDSQGNWSDEQQINNETTVLSFDPSVSINNKGQAVICWDSFDTLSLEFQITSAFRSPSGVWSSEQQVSSSPNSLWNAKVAINNSGEVVSCWWVNEPDDYNIYSASTNFQDSWTEEQQINNQTGGSANISRYPEIAMNNSGEAIVCWYTRDSSKYNIYAAARDSEGNWSHEQQINNQTGGSANIASRPITAINDSAQTIISWSTGFSDDSFNVYQAQTTSNQQEAESLYRFSKTGTTTYYQK